MCLCHITAGEQSEVEWTQISVGLLLYDKHQKHATGNLSHSDTVRRIHLFILLSHQVERLCRDAAYSTASYGSLHVISIDVDWQAFLSVCSY